ncbi:amino acid adenylation domain-containing protein [Labedaea rhizosphaerae]|uniref:Amino acid adenylation domain-containing protein n=1 Tax=Labedaea rhizosphaerae TaxID=598644 RepID=A0A4R6S786_LABRH|nr:amino acid adenylation domain-containing protein [Labedaea rhizosphaerae]TDP95214.1 amino acid adenylation domain-containing protein [Labedaea rhizosphaerae]
MKGEPMPEAVPSAWMVADRPGVPVTTVADLIARNAAEHPDVVAVRQWDTTLTYRELLGRAARLALTLREQGIEPEDRVGVCVGRHPGLLVALLGTLLSGAAYVPLDPDLPEQRLIDTAADAGVKCVVGNAVFADGIPVPDEVAEVRPCPALPGNAAYVIYTSGSTGRPKGVVVSHANVAAFMTSIHERGRIERGDNALAITSIAFDVSVLELLVGLMVGASIQLAAESDRADPERLRRFMVEHEVTWAEVPPALLPLLSPDDLPLVRKIVTGAEAPGPEQVGRWTADGRRLMNGYGPTETTVAVTGFPATGQWSTPIPIGQPMLNHRVYVVDENFALVPRGVPGELLIGGPGVTRGYLGAPGLTAGVFVPDPFGDEPGARLYRSGDLVSWGEDGQLRFHGRVDRQVKVRGQRVELGEIESVLRGHPGVTHAVVAAVPVRDEVSLAAFVTPATAPDDLRDYLGERLPAVMVPSRIERLDALPLNSSDKVDVAALVAGLAQDDGVVDLEGVPGDLAALWSEVLGVPARSAEDDFFVHGGHSLAAMRLVAAVRFRLRRDIAVEDVFAARTLGAFAERVAMADEVTGADIETGHPPALSAAQRRLWFLDQLAPDAAAYNIALAQRLRGPLDVGALSRALTQVVARHDVLRWRVPHDGGRPYAVVDPPADLPLPVEDIEPGALADRLHTEAIGRFDLATGNLLRARLLRLAEDDHVLALTAHHAVFDGWSERILYQDLAAAYAGDTLGPLPAAFADYVAWRDERESRRGKDDLSWWTTHLDGAPTVLDLPRDHPRPAEQSYAGAFAGTELSAATDAGIRSLAAELGATPSTVVLAAFGDLLRRVAGRDEVVIGAPVADRRHAAFADLIGFFVDIVPLRLVSADPRTFAEQVAACRDELFDALAHPDAPLERVVDALSLPRDPSRGALVQVLFNVFNFAQSTVELPGIEAEMVPAGLPGSPFDLTTYLVERDGRMRFELVYNPDLYTASRVEALLEALVHLLDEAVARPGAALGTFTPPNLDLLRDGLVEAQPVPLSELPVHVVPPATDTERTVAAAWAGVLGKPSVGVTQNFFDMGGTSMDLVSVAEQLPGKPRVVDLFRFPTVRALAEFLDGRDGTSSALTKAAQRGAARRERAQRRTARQPRRQEGRS